LLTAEIKHSPTQQASQHSPSQHADQQASVQHTDRHVFVQPGDFILVKFSGAKSVVNFVGQVLSLRDDGNTVLWVN